MNPRVLLIPALVAAIVAPSLAEKPQTGKGLALVEMNYIAQAMTFFYLDFGTITTIENLDDILAETATPDFQAINNNGGALVIRPSSGLPERQFLVARPPAVGPPYLTRSSGQQFEGPDGDYDEGTLLDPWGNPYYLYSPLGLVEPKSETVSLRFYGDVFDLYTIVSHGPDGAFGGGDDLELSLGFPQVTETRISAAVLGPLERKTPLGRYQLELRGYGFGTTQGVGAVLLNGVEALPVSVDWSPTRISAVLDSFPGLGATAGVRTATGARTRALPIAFGFGFPVTQASNFNAWTSSTAEFPLPAPVPSGDLLQSPSQRSDRVPMYLHKLEKDEKTTFLAVAKQLASIDDQRIDNQESYMLRYMANEMGLVYEEAEIPAFDEQMVLNVFHRPLARRILVLEGVGIASGSGGMQAPQRELLTDLAGKFQLSGDFLERAETVVKKQVEVMDEFDSLIETDA